MFAQFRTLYPTGQLICELLTVHHGKFVVRSLVQVDGKTIATAMSAAESVEEAEDRARSRSLAILGLNVSEPVVEIVSPLGGGHGSVPTKPHAAVSVPLPATPDPVLDMPVNNDKFTDLPHQLPPPLPTAIPHQDSFVNTQEPLKEEPPIAPIPEAPPPGVDRTQGAGFGSKQLDSDAWLSSSYGEPIPEPEMPTASPSEPQQPVAVGIPSDDIEDISDTIAQIDATLKRLQWKKKQETDCLEQNYGKLSQALLSPAELVDFLEYLEIYSRTTEEIHRLKWSASQGKDYLKQAYGKEARHLLKRDELFDFLQYLESL
ncbi:MAG: hypothetical protein MUE44_33550 [Oscillatoriaceae cyanobacterium Prado104]|jgi:hypothetical protein|nr:hypothetical protein [Oscillatoriaceae cyanobacterium Prado104]